MYDNARTIIRKVYQDCTFTVKMLLKDSDENYIVQSDVTKILYSVYVDRCGKWELDIENNSIPVTAILNTPVTVESVVHNFEYNFPTDLFPKRNETRLLSIRFFLASGNVVAPPEIICITN